MEVDLSSWSYHPSSPSYLILFFYGTLSFALEARSPPRPPPELIMGGITRCSILLNILFNFFSCSRSEPHPPEYYVHVLPLSFDRAERTSAKANLTYII